MRVSCGASRSDKQNGLYDIRSGHGEARYVKRSAESMLRLKLGLCKAQEGKRKNR